MSTSQIPQFQLSAALHAHEKDVRAVAASSSDTVFSASRDMSVIAWSRISSSEFAVLNRLSGHSHFVNALAVFPPSAEHLNGLVASGSSDKTINVYDASGVGTDPIYSLIGHTDNVCALYVSNDKTTLISGSWDKTVRIWKNFQLSQTLNGHEQAVWSVISFGDQVLSASADKSIKLWRDGQCVHTFKGHTDVVRGLALIPNGAGFLSCANDGTIRRWTLDGECLEELHGHTSFVYAVAVSHAGDFAASVGEDRSLRIWHGGQCVQTIYHPCTSVWCVNTLPNGDIITGGSDGTVRLFSTSKDRAASSDVIEAFNNDVAKFAIPSNQVGDLDKSKIPSSDALLTPGKKDGEVKMVKVGDVVEAHQWVAGESRWEKIGEVVDAVGSGRKQTFAGREYDYVFDVEIGEGVPPLKLPYNANENPYVAAQDFITRNELPQDYLDQVANFITSNVQGVSLGPQSGYSDPFTGAGRYIPGGGGAVTGSGSGGSSANSSAPSAARATNSSALPFGLFQAANLIAINSKLMQFDSELKATNPGVALSEEEATSIEKVVTILQRPSESVFRLNFTQADLRALYKVISTWPTAQRFPGIDLLRLVLPHTTLPMQNPDELARIFKGVVEEGGDGKAVDVNRMLATRAVSNLFATDAGRKFVFDRRFEALGWMKAASKGFEGNKNTAVALATVLFNYGLLTKSSTVDEAFIIECLKVSTDFIGNVNDAEALFRAISALQHLVATEYLKEAAELLDLKTLVRSTAAKSSDSRVKTAASETLNKL
ncbi:WD40-repeat-containing domain protein [Cladochytrium replicatum]|nr:WD40-repeat-containing domain protein [Cladochytrium replicatum]